MKIEDVATLIGTAIVLAGFIAGIVAWLFKTGIAPLKQVIENNTAALNLATATIGKHGEKLEDHEIRITTVEVTHDVLGCGKK